MGVHWDESHKKWVGAVSDVLAERYKSGKPKMLVTKYFESKEEAIEAKKKLQADTEKRYWETVTRWARENPLTRNLLLGPKDASEADSGVVYWRPNKYDKHQPIRVVRVSSGKQGFAWRRACDLCETVHDTFIKEVHYCAGHMPKEYLCPHGTPPYSGPQSKCSMCNPKSVNYSIKCSRCQDRILHSKRLLVNGGNGFCAPCEQTLQKEAAETGTEAPEDGKRWEEIVVDKRIALVASRINALADPSSRPTIEQLARDPPPSTPIVECFFYHSQNASHLLEAYEKAGRDGVHQWKGNTVNA